MNDFDKKSERCSKEKFDDIHQHWHERICSKTDLYNLILNPVYEPLHKTCVVSDTMIKSVSGIAYKKIHGIS